MQAGQCIREVPFVFIITTVLSLTSQITNRGENCVAGHRSVIGRSAKSMRRGARGRRLIVARTQSPDVDRPPCSTQCHDRSSYACLLDAGMVRQHAQAYVAAASAAGAWKSQGIVFGQASSLAAFIPRSGFRGSGAPWLCRAYGPVRGGWPGSLTQRTRADRHVRERISLDGHGLHRRPAAGLGTWQAAGGRDRASEA